MSVTASSMSSNRPYLLRAVHEWISDNGFTPYLLVDAAHPGVQVPSQAVKDGRVVLNVARRAVAQLEMGKDRVSFLARFSGVSQAVEVPVSAVLAIYAQENGQGMMFQAEDNPVPTPPTAPEPDSPPKRGGHLRVIK